MQGLEFNHNSKGSVCVLGLELPRWDVGLGDRKDSLSAKLISHGAMRLLEGQIACKDLCSPCLCPTGETAPCSPSLVRF